MTKEKRLWKPESFFEMNVINGILEIIVNHLRSPFLWTNEIISNFRIFQSPTLQIWVSLIIWKGLISASFARFWSTLAHELEKSCYIRKLADLLIIKWYFLSSNFSAVCFELLLFDTVLVTTASAESSC